MAKAQLAHRNSLQSTDPTGTSLRTRAACPTAQLTLAACCQRLTPTTLLLPLAVSECIILTFKIQNPWLTSTRSQYSLEGGKGGGSAEELLPLPTSPPLSTLRFPNIGNVFPCCANTHWRMSARLRLHFGAIPFKTRCRNKVQMSWDTLPLHSVLESTLVLRICLELQCQGECW